MRIQKRRFGLWLLCLAVCAAFAVACVDGGLPDNSGGATVTLTVLDADGTSLYEKELTTQKTVLYDAFNEFPELQVGATSGFLGAFVQFVAIGEIVESENTFGSFSYFDEKKRIEGNDADSLFIAVYHNIDDEKWKGYFSPDLTHNEKTYFSSGVGVSLLPLIDGSSYILKLSSY